MSANGDSPYPVKVGAASLFTGQVPYSQEAEEAVIGAVLVNPEAFLIVASFLQADDFYVLRHAYIWEALDRLSKRNEAVDYLTVMEELRALGRLNEVGGPAYLTQLTSSMPTSMHAEVYGRIVERAAIRRRHLAAADEIRGLALDEEIPVERMEAESQARLMRAQRVSGTTITPMRQAISEHFDRTQEAMENPSELLGIPSSLKILNEYLKGYRAQKLYVYAGRPGMGKSSMLYTEAAFMANLGVPTAFFTLEVGIEEAVDFLVAGETNIEPDRVSRGALSQAEFSKYVRATGKLANWPLFIDDSADLTPAQLRLRCLRLHHEIGLGAVFVDYIQLVGGGRETRYDNRDQEIGYISRSLKQLAKELRIPIIAAAQLSRSVEQRQDKRPLMSDLRESGNIENDADVVMLFYRDDYYNPPPTPNVVSDIEIGIAKHRGGRTGTVKAGFYGAVKKFVEMAKSQVEAGDSWVK